MAGDVAGAEEPAEADEAEEPGEAEEDVNNVDEA